MTESGGTSMMFPRSLFRFRIIRFRRNGYVKCVHVQYQNLHEPEMKADPAAGFLVIFLSVGA